MAETFKHLRFGAAAEEQRRQLKDEESKQLAKRAASGVNEAYIWGQGRPPRTCTVVRRNRRSAMVWRSCRLQKTRHSARRLKRQPPHRLSSIRRPAMYRCSSYSAAARRFQQVLLGSSGMGTMTTTTSREPSRFLRPQGLVRSPLRPLRRFRTDNRTPSCSILVDPRTDASARQPAPSTRTRNACRDHLILLFTICGG